MSESFNDSKKTKLIPRSSKIKMKHETNIRLWKKKEIICRWDVDLSKVHESKHETGDEFTISAGREFRDLTTRLQKKFLVVSHLILPVLS